MNLGFETTVAEDFAHRHHPATFRKVDDEGIMGLFLFGIANIFYSTLSD
jgi:hypothetical protein